MFDLRSNETIVAVSTPPGTGGIGILRLSGPKARAIAAKIFRPAAGEEKKFPERRAVFGALCDREQKIALDEGFLCYFKAPRSYTRQDIVEISVHGSPAVLAEGVRLAVKSGARHALPGEFTLRAYLNGRIDMLQAEAIDDLIRAATPAQARLASRQVLGGLSGRMSALRTSLIDLLADIEAGIEFPEEDIGLDGNGLGLRLNELAGDVDGLVRSYETGKALGEGLTLAIVGRANVGKSTLFNALLGHPRAIVAPQAGTTRDYLREKMRLGDAVLNLVDMAGLGPSSSDVEKEGIRRSGELAGGADGIIFLFDGSVKETPSDLALIVRFAGKKSIIVFNKSDLGRKIDTGKLRRLAPHSPALSLSALTGHNLPALRTVLAKAFVPEFPDGEEIVAHLRQKVLLEEILGKIAAAMSFCRGGAQLELAAEEIRGAIPALERLTGAVRADDVIESIFSRFCVGK